MLQPIPDNIGVIASLNLLPLLLTILLAIKDKDIRLRLAEEDKAELEVGTAESVSASMLIWQGLELEEQQYVHHFSTLHVDY